MGLTECGNYTAGIKAIAGLFPGREPLDRGWGLQRGRAARLGDRAAVRARPAARTLGRQRADGVHRADGARAPLAPAVAGDLPGQGSDGGGLGKARRRHASSAAGSTVTLGQLIRNRQVLGLFLIRVFSGPITTFYWTWLPQYLRTGRGMSFLAIGIFASLPNLFGMTGNVVGGLLTDRLVKLTGSIDRGRKLGFAGAFGLGALSMVMPFVPTTMRHSA